MTALNISTMTVGGTDIKDIINPLTYNSALTHNSRPRRKYLGTVITPAHHTAIANGSFADIYPGDYWYLGNKYNIIVADCNYFGGYENAGGNITLPNHIAALVISAGGKPMSDTVNASSVTGGLADTKMYKETMPETLGELETLIGADYIIPKSNTIISDAVDYSTGNVTHWTNKTERIFMATAGQLHGIYTGHSQYLDMDRQFAVMRFTTWGTLAGGMQVNAPFNVWLAEIAHFSKTSLAADWNWARGGLNVRGGLDGWHNGNPINAYPLFWILLK